MTFMCRCLKMLGFGVLFAVDCPNALAQGRPGILILPPPGSSRPKRPQSSSPATQPAPQGVPLPATPMVPQVQGIPYAVPNQPLVIQYAAPPNPSDYIGGYLEAAGGQLYAVPSATLDSFKTKSGTTAEAKILLDVTAKRYILDAGAGIYFYKVSGVEPIIDSSGAQTKNKDGTAKTGDFGLSTYGTTVDLCASLRLHPKLFIGTALQVRRPSDLGYTSSVVRSGTAFLAGGQIGYEFEGGDIVRRLVLRASRGFNTIEWTDFHFYAGLQFGVPFVSTVSK